MPNNLTSQQSTAKRIFQAIDGTELKRIVLAEISRKLDEDRRFARHLTYPVFSFGFNIVIEAYPMEPPRFKVVGGYKRVLPDDSAQVEVPTEIREHVSHQDDKNTERLEASGQLHVDAPAEGGLAPDEARERADIPIPTPAGARIGRNAEVVVDTNVPSTAASAPDAVPLGDTRSSVPLEVDEDAAALATLNSPHGTQRLAAARDNGGVVKPASEPVNRKGASPNFARSVDLKTRVNPDGTRVDTNITGDAVK